MKKKIGWILFACLFVLVLGACQRQASEQLSIEERIASPAADRGYLTLSINPKVTIEYDEEAQVTDIFGLNEAGVDVVNEMKDISGQKTDQILSQLVPIIHDKGYFIDEEKDEIRDINLEVEAGSVIPYDNFLEEMTVTLEEALGELDLEEPLTEEDIIALDEAKKIALDHAKVKEEDATFKENKQKFDINEKTKKEDLVYHLEFEANGKQYKYDINAVSGDIVKSENKKADDQDDDKDKSDSDTDDSQKKDGSASKEDSKSSSPEKQNSSKAQPSHSSNPKATPPQSNPSAGRQYQAPAPSRPAPSRPAPSRKAPSRPQYTAPAPPRYYDDDDDDDDYDDDDDDDDDD